MKLSACRNIEDLRKKAMSRLPSPMYHYIAGGADDEVSMQRNTDAFDDYQLMPNYLVDVGKIDTRTSLFGKQIDLPFFLSPTGMSRLFHHGKEHAVARAAEKFGTYYSLSTMATTTLEEIAESSGGPKIFQIYILKDRSLTTEFVERAKAARYDALCLTVDTAMAGNRERDLMTGMTIPPSFGLNSLMSFASSPSWVMNFMLHPKFNVENVAHRVDALKAGSMGLVQYVNEQFDRTVTWDDAAWLAKQWDGPLILKGLQSPTDAQRARDIGASAIMISNHGGRQLDGAPAPIDCVKSIRDAVGDSLELVVDGGVRRGTHVIKALAAGANACSIGRPYLYGLAAGGQPGVEQALNILKTEIERNMALLGCRQIADIRSDHLADMG